jgi:hypothetical protein
MGTSEVSSVAQQTKELTLEKEAKEMELARVNKDYQCVNKLLTNERNGVYTESECGSSSQKAGIGAKYGELEGRVSSLGEDKKRIEKRLGEIQSVLSKNGTTIIKATTCSKDSIAAKIEREPPSLLAANSSLQALIFDSANVGESTDKQRGVGTMVFFFTLLIILLELSPVIVKLFQKSGTYDQKLEEYETDCLNMSYLDLIQKYSHMPKRKEYLQLFQDNKDIYEKLLAEHIAISELNSQVQMQMNVIQDKMTIQQTNEKIVNEKVAETIKESQIKIIEKIISLWESKITRDINKNPQNYVDIPQQQTINTPQKSNQNKPI